MDNAPNYLPCWVRYPKQIYTCRYAPGCETKSSDAKDEPLLQVDTKTSLTCMVPGLKGEVFSFWLKIFSWKCVFYRLLEQCRFLKKFLFWHGKFTWNWRKISELSLLLHKFAITHLISAYGRKSKYFQEVLLRICVVKWKLRFLSHLIKYKHLIS